MTRSLYVIGGAGTGKSTFTASVLEGSGVTVGPCEVFHRRRKMDGVMDPISGHQLWGDAGRGLYIGRMRDSFPGTDALSRSCTPVGVEWLESASLPAFIIGEGATLATQGFLGALAERTELMVVHLRANPNEVARRMLERGSSQKESFVKSTVTRSANMLSWIGLHGAEVLDVPTDLSMAYEIAVDISVSWIQFTSP